MKKIILAGSSKFIDKIEYYKKYFSNNGYTVLACPKKIDQTNINIYDNTYKLFFKALNETDEIFVVNEEKNGIKGYVGAETFAELSFVLANNILKNEKRKIYLLNEPDEKNNCFYELNAFIKLGYIEIWNKNNNNLN